MLNKEEKLFYSLTALKEVIETWDIDVELTLTKDGSKHTINAYEEIERCVVECINNTQPYKFEDLKPNMFVFDLVKNRVNKILEIFDADCSIPYLKFDDGFGEWFIIEFKENRFFPVQMANVRCE